MNVILPSVRESILWEHPGSPNAREQWPFGVCHTSSGKHVVCCLGGIGCDVDHVTMARLNIHQEAKRMQVIVDVDGERIPVEAVRAGQSIVRTEYDHEAQTMTLQLDAHRLEWAERDVETLHAALTAIRDGEGDATRVWRMAQDALDAVSERR